MQYYLEKNVYEAALERVRWLYDEFEEIIVSISGGKDSTVCFHLALQVAKERGRLPLNILWIDQEAEWQNTVDYQKTLFYRDDVKPYWMQIPMKMFNSANFNEGFREVWNPGGKWMREKDPISIKENTYGTERFSDLFNKIILKEFKGKKACNIGGVRCEESPQRRSALTQCATYKGETWGKSISDKEQKYIFYPIYDWTYRDVWTYISKNNLPYNKIYDIQYSYGCIEKSRMRVSNLHHETAVHHLIEASEQEPETWSKLQEFITGSNSIRQLPEVIHCPEELPFMFKGWKEYRDYLFEKLVDLKFKAKFSKEFKRIDVEYEQYENIESLYKEEITAILTNDVYFTKLRNTAGCLNQRLYKKAKKKIYGNI